MFTIKDERRQGNMNTQEDTGQPANRIEEYFMTLPIGL